jgi:ribosomal protein S11
MFQNILLKIPTSAPKVKSNDTPIIHINTTKNNTIVSLTKAGNLLKIQSCGTIGLKKSNRKTSDGGYQTTIELLKQAGSLVNKGVFVFFKGFGRGRDSAWRALRASEVDVLKVLWVNVGSGCNTSYARWMQAKKEEENLIQIVTFYISIILPI